MTLTIDIKGEVGQNVEIVAAEIADAVAKMFIGCDVTVYTSVIQRARKEVSDKL